MRRGTGVWQSLTRTIEETARLTFILHGYIGRPIGSPCLRKSARRAAPDVHRPGYGHHVSAFVDQNMQDVSSMCGEFIGADCHAGETGMV